MVSNAQNISQIHITNTIAGYEEFLHTFHMKTCTHKTH
jgi:hypothetical protein